MKLGVMQPYFFPYLGYFDLINRVDTWIIFDVAQYMRHGWVSRNRVLHPAQGWWYVIVPLKQHHFTTPINQIETTEPAQWRRRILNQLLHYRKRAPYFDQTFRLVEECLCTEDTNLARLNTRVMGRVCQCLGIVWRPAIFSQMQLQLGPIETADDWAIRISEATGATEYINPPGGVNLYDPARFARIGVRLTILKPFEFEYECPGYKFEPSLSVIDALMWNSPEKIKAHLDRSRESSGIP